MLSKGTVEILLDLVEIKLSAIIVQDREDIREVLKLKRCKKELLEAEKQLNNRKRHAESPVILNSL